MVRQDPRRPVLVEVALGEDVGFPVGHLCRMDGRPDQYHGGIDGVDHLGERELRREFEFGGDEDLVGAEVLGAEVDQPIDELRDGDAQVGAERRDDRLPAAFGHMPRLLDEIRKRSDLRTNRARHRWEPWHRSCHQ